MGDPRGQSAGAIVTSMAVWQRPELFGAAIFGSGVLDTLRAEFGASGEANSVEHGTIAREDEFRALYAMSALQNVRSDRPYPPMLFSVGANDPRMSPWSSAKVVARLQSLPGARHTVLLRVDFQDGHGVGSSVDSEVSRYADYYAFAFDALTRNPKQARP